MNERAQHVVGKAVRPFATQRLILAVAIVTVSVGLGTTVTMAVTPVSSGNVTGSPVLINTSPGNQTDPHVSGDLAAYTDESTGSIRYYDFLTMAPGSINTPLGATDQLSDVNGNHIAFARIFLSPRWV